MKENMDTSTIIVTTKKPPLLATGTAFMCFAVVSKHTIHTSYIYSIAYLLTPAKVYFLYLFLRRKL